MGEVLSYLREIIYHLSPKKTQHLAKLSPLLKEILSSPEEDWASKYLSIGNMPSICIYPPVKGILFFWKLSCSAPGCVTCHTRHGPVTHFRPILGNVVEVTLVTPPTNVYKFHH